MEKELKKIFNKSITREKFLKTLSLISLLGLEQCMGLNKFLFKDLNKNQKFEDAENFFKTFPGKIPNVEKIVKCYTPHAKYCLVHIKNFHYRKEMKNTKLFSKIKNKKLFFRQIDSLQKNIYEILEFFIEKRKVKNFRVEGIDNEEINPYERIKKYYEEIKKEYGMDYLGGGLNKIIIEKKAYLKPTETKRGKFNANLIEDLVLSYKHPEVLSEFFKKLYVKYVYDEREDIVLKLIAKDKFPYSIMVYGGTHVFGGKKSCRSCYNPSINIDLSYKDNIYEWNKIYPNKKFSLIEIFPKGYGKLLFKLK